MFSFFQTVRIINLPHRSDRRQEMLAEMRRVGMAACEKVKFYEAVRPEEQGPFTSIGARGAFESHIELVRLAAEANTSVLIIEDDCDFLKGAEKYVVPAGTDIFYGGYNALDPFDLMTSDIMGAHLMGFSHRACTAMLRYLQTLNFEGTHPPIDAFYVWLRRAHPELVTHFANPILGFQRPSRTDIAAPNRLENAVATRPFLKVGRAVKRQLQKLGRAAFRREDA